MAKARMETRNSMGRMEIKKEIKNQLDIPFSVVSQLVEDAITELIDTLVNGEHIKISSFGTFIVHTKKERIGRNPRTKEEAIIAPRKTVSFRASKKLKVLVDKK